VFFFLIAYFYFLDQWQVWGCKPAPACFGMGHWLLVIVKEFDDMFRRLTYNTRVREGYRDR